jgi:hypothetical protein
MTVKADRRAAKTAAVVVKRLQSLERMDSSALRAEWRKLYGQNAPPRVTRKLLLLAVAYRIQERAYGGLSAAAKRQLQALGETIDARGDVVRDRISRLKPGTRLVREWHGESHTVIVLEAGFEWRGRQWRSLTAIAREITGARWSGPRFFGLKPAMGNDAIDLQEEAPGEYD